MFCTRTRHLAAADPRLAGVIRQVGRCRLTVERGREPYESLLRAIAHQQLHSRAAAAILGRFLALYPGESFPAPEQVLLTDVMALSGIATAEMVMADLGLKVTLGSGVAAAQEYYRNHAAEAVRAAA